MYDESMSPACQRGLCDDCPENDDPDGYCACTHHIPDDADEAADALAEAWYENYYGTARA